MAPTRTLGRKREGTGRPLQNQTPTESMQYFEESGAPPASSIDVLAILRSVLRRWKLVVAVTLSVSIATYGALKLVPKSYKSTVEILVYDPQGQIDATIQKPISPFVDAVTNDAMATEINILRSKSVALRVASEQGLDANPEFQSHSGGLRKMADRLAKVLGIPKLSERLGFSFPTLAYDKNGEIIGPAESKAEKLDRAAEALLKSLEVWQESYIINVAVSARDPAEAQRLASAIANDYLASQREARQTALDHVATWLRRRADDLQSQIIETEVAIERLKAESGIRDAEPDNVREQQALALSTQVATAREDVNDKRARLEQARQVIETNGDIDSIAEFTTSASLSDLRHRQRELTWNAAELQSKFGQRNIQVVSIQTELAAVNKQIEAETQHVIGNMKNAYDIAVRREQALEANLQGLTAHQNSEAYIKLQQLRHLAEADRKDYENYINQYNDISERRELQSSGPARIVSPASFPRTPSKSRAKFYALGGLTGLGGGLMLAFLLEFFGPGVKTSAEVEQTFHLPVVGAIPLAPHGKTGVMAYQRLLDTTIHQPLSQLSEAVRAIRISLELLSGNPKVVLFTSALPGEGKSTAAMLLAASSANSDRKTILLDCDFRKRSTSEALRRHRSKHRPGLSELLRGAAKLEDVIAEDPLTKIHLIPTGSPVTNAADLLMSREMLDLIAVLRKGYDYVVLDAPPVLPVVDALALATVADKILVVVEWRRTPRASIYEAFRVLGRAADRVAGVVLNKVEFDQLPGYGGGYQYRSLVKYYGDAPVPAKRGDLLL